MKYLGLYAFLMLFAVLALPGSGLTQGNDRVKEEVREAFRESAKFDFDMTNAAPLQEDAEPKSIILSETEKAVFSFHKLLGKQVNYEKIVEGMQEYQEEELMFVLQEIYDREAKRLRAAWKIYNPDLDYINIRTSVIMQIRVIDKTPHFTFRFAAAAPGEEVLMPFEYDGDSILLDAPDMERFAHLPLTKANYERLRQYFDINGNYEGRVKIELRPTFASEDIEQQQGNRVKFLRFMKVEVASIEFEYDHNGKTVNPLPRYEASWYGTVPEDSILLQRQNMKTQAKQSSEDDDEQEEQGLAPEAPGVDPLFEF